MEMLSCDSQHLSNERVSGREILFKNYHISGCAQRATIIRDEGCWLQVKCAREKEKNEKNARENSLYPFNKRIIKMKTQKSTSDCQSIEHRYDFYCSND